MDFKEKTARQSGVWLVPWRRDPSVWIIARKKVKQTPVLTSDSYSRQLISRGSAPTMQIEVARESAVAVYPKSD